MVARRGQAPRKISRAMEVIGAVLIGILMGFSRGNREMFERREEIEKFTRQFVPKCEMFDKYLKKKKKEGEEKLVEVSCN